MAHEVKVNNSKNIFNFKFLFVNNLRNGLCIFPITYQSRQELVKENIEIYPLYKHKVLAGTMLIGIHKFYETIDEKKETFASTAKFSNIWLLENGRWKLTKSVSYDHMPSSKQNSFTR